MTIRNLSDDGVEPTISDAYVTVSALIFKLVGDFKTKHPWMDFDELLSEANFAFVKMWQRYDAGISKLVTYLTSTINFTLLSYRNRVKHHYRREVTDQDHVCDTTLAPETTCWDRIDEMTEDAQRLCQVVIDPPPEVSESIKSAASWNRVIRKHMKCVENWSDYRLDRTFCELRSVA